MAMPASSGYPNSRAALASACAAADPAGIRSDRPPEEGSGGRNSTASTTAATQPRMTGNRSPTMRYAYAFATKARTTPQPRTFTNPRALRKSQIPSLLNEPLVPPSPLVLGVTAGDALRFGPFGPFGVRRRPVQLGQAPGPGGAVAGKRRRPDWSAVRASPVALSGPLSPARSSARPPGPR